MKRVEGMAFEDYATHKALSSTMLSTRSRMSWAHAQVTKPDSTEFQIGRAVHCKALQPEIYGLCYGELPSTDGICNKDGSPSKAPESTTEYKNLVRDMKMNRPDVQFMPRADFRKVEAMADSVRREAKEYVEDLRTEVSFFFELDGVSCKSRLDGLNDNKKRIVELKTTHCAEPRVFGYDVKKWGYAIQMAWQGIAVNRVLGWTPQEYIIAAVENVPPYCCTIHRMSNAWIAECEERCMKYVEEYKSLPTDKPWPGYLPLVNVIDFSTGDEE